MERQINITRSFDKVAVWLFALLVIFGWLSIYAAVYEAETGFVFDMDTRYVKQFFWILAAVAIIFLVFIFDTKFFMFFSYPIYFTTILLLIVVLIFGTTVNGARAWIEIGPMRIQPAEFTKYATALVLARIMSSYNFKLFTLRNMVKIGVVLLIPFLLIILQNDTGSALIYIAFVIVLYREGMPGGFLLVGFISLVSFFISLVYGSDVVFISLIVLAFSIYFVSNKLNSVALIAILAFLSPVVLLSVLNWLKFSNLEIYQIIVLSFLFNLPLYLYRGYKKRDVLIFLLVVSVILTFTFSYGVDYFFHNVLEPHQRTRINVLIGLEQDLRGAGYNVYQSMVAIGSGGPIGKGFLQGTQTKFKFVPEQSTDFIFCTIGEEWGFLGAALVVILFVALLIRIIVLAERQKAAFSRIFGYGVASILFFHFAVNIGMTIGLAPVIGVPLPFISYGGSSLWSFTLLLFTFLRLDAERSAQL
ncbi:MAG TPA: rod shape-determining protein RodA [Bacteroidales bacterium]|nr:rod shape-determining protein RodA [Bacteroidales bacterium]